MVAAAANLVLLFHLGPISKESYVFGPALFLVNLVSWVSYLTRTSWGASSERILSVCRMLMIIVAATIWGSVFAVVISPVGMVLWEQLIRVLDYTGRRGFWTACALLFALEALYLYRLGFASELGPLERCNGEVS